MKRIAVVLSQGQSHNPAKRKLEEEIVTRLMIEPGVDVTVVPHLYDLKPDGTGILALQGIKGSMIILSWLYPRAARWLLDRNDIAGHEGHVMLQVEDEDEEDDEAKAEDEADGDEEGMPEVPRVVDQREIPNRKIYCLDLRASTEADAFVEEVQRIARESSTQVVQLDQWLSGTPNADAKKRFDNPTNSTALGPPAEKPTNAQGQSANETPSVTEPIRIEESAGRRWYPVIDFSRCTNCMECIDFCLFGVYGVDGQETILVEQPDNCRKGCPACSRVCPENAIIFPQHKSPAIAGAAGVAESLKIDLSKLFGAPDEKEDPLATAARERDEQLMLAGREAVGMSVGVPKRQADKKSTPKDELDSLIDELDEFDL